MAESRTWAIKGVSERTRATVQEAARAEGLAVGEWIDRALAKAAEEVLHPKPPAATREDVAEVVRELLDERLTVLAEKVERAAAAATGNGTSPIEAVRTRLRQRRAL